MLLFHGELSWMSGGFLGVSTFYTLSGFLITSLVLEERQATGRLALGRFWMRRARRLLPAAGVVLFAVTVTAPWTMDPDGLRRLRGELPWVLLSLSNWWLVAEDYSYALLFADPSPLQHFWSLAIEGQFYLALPLSMLLAARLPRGRRGPFGVLFGVLALASVGWTAFLYTRGATTDRIYYGTDTRASEILLGCALAAALGPRALAGGLSRGGGRVSALGFAALLATFACWGLADLDSAWLYRGGLSLYAIASAALVLAALVSGGPFGRLVGSRPLAWLGRVSYGAYLYHWPIYLALTPERVGLPALPTLALRIGSVLVLSWLSEKHLERPIRRRAWPRDRTFLLSAGVAAAGVALLPRLTGIGAPVSEPPALPPPIHRAFAGTHEPLRFAFFGDSTMLTLSMGLGSWLAQASRGDRVPGVTLRGCGLHRDGEWGDPERPRPVPRQCLQRPAAWRRALARSDPQLAIVLVGPWEIVDRRLPGHQRFAGLGDEALDRATKAEILDAVDLLSSRGALVVWLETPHVTRIPGARRNVERFNRRADRFNELLVEAARLRPESLRLVDLAAYMDAEPGRLADTTLRRDGVHFRIAGARRIAADWLGTRILDVYAAARLGSRSWPEGERRGPEATRRDKRSDLPQARRR